MHRKLTLALAVSITVALILTVYTASAYFVAASISEHSDGSLWWPNTAGGEPSIFFPWPYVPAGIHGQAFTELNQVDAQYYRCV